MRTKKNVNNKHLLVAVITFCLVCILGGIGILALTGGEDHHTSPEASSSQTASTAGGSDPDETVSDQNESGESDSGEAGSGKGNPKTSGIVVYIETGHGREKEGGWDGGCSWSDGDRTYEEAQLMIPIAKAMADYLKKAGVTVYTDAYDENNLNLEETLDFLDQHREVDAMINLHCDWENADSGTMPLYRTEEQLALARAVNRGVHKVIQIPDRGETYRDDLDTTTSEKAHCPAIIFETGSIRADNEILTSRFDDYGRGLAMGVCDYFGIPFSFPISDYIH